MSLPMVALVGLKSCEPVRLTIVESACIKASLGRLHTALDALWTSSTPSIGTFTGSGSDTTHPSKALRAQIHLSSISSVGQIPLSTSNRASVCCAGIPNERLGTTALLL